MGGRHLPKPKLNVCECGCGEPCENRFVHNHHTRMAWHKAKVAEGHTSWNHTPNAVLDLELFNRLFVVDAERGLLIRRVRRGPNALAGSPVGRLDTKGYLFVTICDVHVRVHRIIFLMHYGWLPPEIDHENTNKTDNRPANLRPATTQQNAGNTWGHRNNTSGFKGVSWNTRMQRWHAQIKLNGKQTYLGWSDTKEGAFELYCTAARHHFGEYARLERA